MAAQVEEKRAEPASGLGKAIAYMIKHWEPLTVFQRVPGAVLDNNLDNNIVERALKKVVLHRKNALFYKTDHGADVGNLFMSLIHTANLNWVNPFAYLVALLKHAEDLAEDPAAWVPWAYQDRLAGEKVTA